ncbi:uncharacterized protein LOC123534473 [Mercenaria mercenaria]|uniref:uncharacterized protein LOC123534473 n=1 Tax=Mercenaria mercenaria TaxID=6596 RepID=UPI00234E835C|nr:uncharacterized protein LOC123534473 [Mercenaria mercenaria]
MHIHVKYIMTIAALSVARRCFGSKIKLFGLNRRITGATKVLTGIYLLECSALFQIDNTSESFNYKEDERICELCSPFPEDSVTTTSEGWKLYASIDSSSGSSGADTTTGSSDTTTGSSDTTTGSSDTTTGSSGGGTSTGSSGGADGCTGGDSCTYEEYSLLVYKCVTGSGCQKFCQCAPSAVNTDGSVVYSWVEQSCAAGLVFDTSLKVCNWP